MTIRDYWVYQGRGDVETPWALYIVKTFDRRYPDRTTLDYTIFSEDIKNATHSKTISGIMYGTVTGYVDDILGEISQYSGITAEDRVQLERSVLNILQD